MKTTVELPDDLMRSVKVRAAREDKKLKDLIAELLMRGLADSPSGAGRSRSTGARKLPVVKCRHAAREGEELTPAQAAAVLLQQEAEWQQ